MKWEHYLSLPTTNFVHLNTRQIGLFMVLVFPHLELPLKSGTFIAQPQPFAGNFGVFEDSLPNGYGRYLLHKALLHEGINDMALSTLDRLSIIGNGAMGALTYKPITSIHHEKEVVDLDMLQQKALDVLSEKTTTMPIYFYSIA